MRSRDLARLGKEFRAAHAGFAPDRVRRSGRKTKRKALEALGDGIGWLSRLWMFGEGLQHVTLALHDLGLDHLEAESNLYDHDAVQTIKAAVLETFTGSLWARLEVGGRERKLHAHVLAFSFPTRYRFVSKVESLEGMAQYISKPQVPGDDLSAGIFLEARAAAKRSGKRLPFTVFKRGIPNP